MEEQSFGNGNVRRALPPTLRDFLAIGFRHRRLIVVSFLGTFLGTILAVLWVGNRYEAHMEILVKHERVDPVVTTGPNAVGSFTQDVVTEEEMNSEVELIRSQDLLEEVVVTCGLHLRKPHFWSPWIPTWVAAEALRIPKAVRKLSKELNVEPVKKSDLIEVIYASRDPELAARVLNTLGNLYLAKHLAVHRPPGEFNFFQQQAAQYRKSLAALEVRLADFGRTQGVVAAQAERDIALQKVNEFDAALGQTQAAIAGTAERIRALQAELALTPPRLSTQVRTSPQLLEQLKSALLTLELKRTELLGKFEPGYPLVQEVEAQIAQTRSAITAAEKAPVHEDTTDQNPTYQWLSGELAKAKADLSTLQASAAATARLVRAYRDKIQFLDQKGFAQQDLIRAAKAEEANYLLYLNKQEEARISDALDSKRISNVVIAEAATVPALPAHSPGLFILLGGLLAIVVSAGSAFASDYLDPSFRTPDEVQEFLDVPVLAALPENAHALLLRNGQ